MNYIEKLREVNPKRAEILERLLSLKKETKQTETGKLLAEGLSKVTTIKEVRDVAQNILNE